MPIISLAGASAAVCLQAAIYFEARSESVEAQIAVAQVVINRVDSPLYPNDICSVVKQKNQFSWYWDGAPEYVGEIPEWEKIGGLAEYIIEANELGVNMVADDFDATHFVSGGIRPSWTQSDFFTYDMKIAAFDFYTEERRW